jgi:hypothetical protein
VKNILKFVKKKATYKAKQDPMAVRQDTIWERFLSPMWWINQITSGIKPILHEETNTHQTRRQYIPTPVDSTIDKDLQGFPSPAFDTMP